MRHLVLIAFDRRRQGKLFAHASEARTDATRESDVWVKIGTAEAIFNPAGLAELLITRNPTVRLSMPQARVDPAKLSD